MNRRPGSVSSRAHVMAAAVVVVHPLEARRLVDHRTHAADQRREQDDQPDRQPQGPIARPDQRPNPLQDECEGGAAQQRPGHSTDEVRLAGEEEAGEQEREPPAASQQLDGQAQGASTRNRSVNPEPEKVRLMSRTRAEGWIQPIARGQDGLQPMGAGHDQEPRQDDEEGDDAHDHHPPECRGEVRRAGTRARSRPPQRRWRSAGGTARPGRAGPRPDGPPGGHAGRRRRHPHRQHREQEPAAAGNAPARHDRVVGMGHERVHEHRARRCGCGEEAQGEQGEGTHGGQRDQPGDDPNGVQAGQAEQLADQRGAVQPERRVDERDVGEVVGRDRRHHEPGAPQVIHEDHDQATVPRCEGPGQHGGQSDGGRHPKGHQQREGDRTGDGSDAVGHRISRAGERWWRLHRRTRPRSRGCPGPARGAPGSSRRGRAAR